MNEKFYAVVFSYQEYFVKESKCIILSESKIQPEDIVEMVQRIFSTLKNDMVGPNLDTWLFEWPASLNWVSDLIPGSSVKAWDTYDIAYVLKQGKLYETEVQSARYLYTKTGLNN